jgi:hypothetical protein
VATELEVARKGLHGNGAVSIGLALATVVLWLVFLFVAHANLRPLGRRGMRFRPAIAVAAWLVPVVNMGLPYFSMRELWRASDPDGGGTEWMKRRTSLLLPLWWLGVLATAVLLAMGDRAGAHLHPTIEQLMRRDRLLLAASAVAIPTAALAGVLIQRVAGLQAVSMNRALAGGWSSWRGDQGPGPT